MLKSFFNFLDRIGLGIILILIWAIYAVLYPETCDNTSEKYRKVAFNFKVKKISDNRQSTLEGIDSKGNIVIWEDISRTIFDHYNIIDIGDSIKKSLVQINLSLQILLLRKFEHFITNVMIRFIENKCFFNF